MSHYETVLSPHVATTEVSLHDTVEGYGHNFTLHYIISCDDTTVAATFAFGKRYACLLVYSSVCLCSADKKYFQIQFGPIDYCLNWGVS